MFSLYGLLNKFKIPSILTRNILLLASTDTNQLNTASHKVSQYRRDSIVSFYHLNP